MYITKQRIEKFHKGLTTFDNLMPFGAVILIVLGFILGGCGDEHNGYQRRPHHDSPDPTGGSSGGYDDPPYDDDDDDYPPNDCESVPQLFDLRAYDCHGADQQTHDAQLAVGVQLQDQVAPEFFYGEGLNDNGHLGEGLELEDPPAANNCGPVKLAVVTFGQPWLQASENVEIWEFQKEAVEIAFRNIQGYDVQDLSTWWTEDMVNILMEVFSCQVEGHCAYEYSMPPDAVHKLGVDDEASSQVCGLGLYLLRSYE